MLKMKFSNLEVTATETSLDIRQPLKNQLSMAGTALLSGYLSYSFIRFGAFFHRGPMIFLGVIILLIALLMLMAWITAGLDRVFIDKSTDSVIRAKKVFVKVADIVGVRPRKAGVVFTIEFALVGDRVRPVNGVVAFKQEPEAQRFAEYVAEFLGLPAITSPAGPVQ